MSLKMYYYNTFINTSHFNAGRLIWTFNIIVIVPDHVRRSLHVELNWIRIVSESNGERVDQNQIESWLFSALWNPWTSTHFSTRSSQQEIIHPKCTKTLRSCLESTLVKVLSLIKPSYWLGFRFDRFKRVRIGLQEHVLGSLTPDSFGRCRMRFVPQSNDKEYLKYWEMVKTLIIHSMLKSESSTDGFWSSDECWWTNSNQHKVPGSIVYPHASFSTKSDETFSRRRITSDTQADVQPTLTVLCNRSATPDPLRPFHFTPVALSEAREITRRCHIWFEYLLFKRCT